MNELRFAYLSIKKNLQGSAELRTSFIATIIGMVLNNISFIVIWTAFVSSVGVINGWGVKEIIGLQAFTSICYGIVFSLAGGIQKLPEYVSSGGFDRFMLAPKNILLRVLTSVFHVSALGDVLFGVLCFIGYGYLIHAGFREVGVMLFLIATTTVTFLAVTIITFSTSFYFTDSNSVANGFFELFFTPSLYPGGAVQGSMRLFFTFLIPSLLIGAIPVELIHSFSVGKLVLMGVAALGWLFLSLWFFNISIKRYESSGLMSFGS